MSIILNKEAINKIELIDKLRVRFSPEENRKLKLPQIIVVGNQSSGKSSLLEAISGIKLPKGVETVTRCPIIIQMKKSEKQRTKIMYLNSDNKEVEKIITDTEKEIKEVQRCVFGNNLTDKTITITTESPNLNTLTMIDLPGIIKTETTDHVENAKEKTVEIAKSYIEQENSLIICVLPANQDFSSTTTIGLAETYNKDKSRIIVALTKLDKLDKKEVGTIPGILSNKKLPIEKGYFGLIVSDDILEASFDKRSQLEAKKLKTLPFWKDYKERLGLKNFESVLVRELNCLIDKTLPILRTNIYRLIKETENELGTFSKYNDNKDLQYSYINECQKDIDHIIEVILCKADEEIITFPSMKEFLEANNLLNPVRESDTFLYFWHKIFKALFDDFNGIWKEICNRPYNSYQNLNERIKRLRTENSSLFISPKIYTRILDEILDCFFKLTSECIDKCYHFIEHMIETVLTMNIENELDSMKTDIQKYGREVLKKQKQETIDHLKYLFESEKSYFSQEDIKDTDNDDASTPSETLLQARSFSLTSIFGGVSFSASNHVSSRIPRNSSNDKPEKDISKYKNGMILKEYLENYVMGLVGRLGDVIPNFIRLSLFVKFQEELRNFLISTVFQPERFPLYFHISEERKEVFCKLKVTLEKLKESEMEIDHLGSKGIILKIPKT